VSRQVAREVRQMAQDAAQALNMEARYKAQLISSNAPDMSPLLRSLADEAASFQRDFQVISRAASQMYARNEFFSRSIAEATAQAVQTVKRAAAEAVTAAAQATAQARVVLAQQWEQFVFQVNRIPRQSPNSSLPLIISNHNRIIYIVEQNRSYCPRGDEIVRSEMKCTNSLSVGQLV
jgi:hypothetical protein